LTTSSTTARPLSRIPFRPIRTASFFTVGGSAAENPSTENGRNSRTFQQANFSPLRFKYSTVSCAASALEPMITITRSASGRLHNRTSCIRGPRPWRICPSLSGFSGQAA
jgi:hypothetical protein